MQILNNIVISKDESNNEYAGLDQYLVYEEWCCEQLNLYGSENMNLVLVIDKLTGFVEDRFEASDRESIRFLLAICTLFKNILQTERKDLAISFVQHKGGRSLYKVLTRHNPANLSDMDHNHELKL